MTKWWPKKWLLTDYRCLLCPRKFLSSNYLFTFVFVFFLRKQPFPKYAFHRLVMLRRFSTSDFCSLSLFQISNLLPSKLIQSLMVLCRNFPVNLNTFLLNRSTIRTYISQETSYEVYFHFFRKEHCFVTTLLATIWVSWDTRTFQINNIMSRIPSLWLFFSLLENM